MILTHRIVCLHMYALCVMKKNLTFYKLFYGPFQSSKLNLAAIKVQVCQEVKVSQAV